MLDIVYLMYVFLNWIFFEIFEFVFYDIDCILRFGGVLWFDYFFCIQFELDIRYVLLIRSFGYKELRWDVGKKFDCGVEKKEVYFFVFFEKFLIGRY